MARVDNLTNFLNDVAAAIKEKTGDSTSIPAAQFDTKILSIETGGNYQDKSMTISTNGNYNVLPDSGYDAMTSVGLTVNVLPNNQTKSANVIANGTYNIEPDTGYDGLGSVEVNVNVPSGETINNQDKTITQNGVYTADQGYTGLGEVTVDVDQPVKLFDTVEHMQQDPTAQEGDKAIVYRSEFQNLTASTQFSSATFPATVTVPTAIENSIELSFRAVDSSSGYFSGYGSITATAMDFDCYMEEGSIQITYTSSDGITYTRTDSGDSAINFGTNIQYEDYGDMWDDRIGYFFQVGGYVFEGLYENKILSDESKLNIYDLNAVTVDTTNQQISIATPTETISKGIINDAINALYEYKQSQLGSANVIKAFITLSNDKSIVRLYGNHYYNTNQSWIYGKEDIILYNNIFYALTYNSSKNHDDYVTSMKVWDYNIQTGVITENNFNKTQDFYLNDTVSGFTGGMPMNEHYVIGTISLDSLNWISLDYITDLEKPKHWTATGNFYNQFNIQYPTHNIYIYASTQLSDLTVSDVLTGITAYGNNGVVTGDGSVYDNLDTQELRHKTFNLTRGAYAEQNNLEMYSGEPTKYATSIENESKISYLKNGSLAKVCVGVAELKNIKHHNILEPAEGYSLLSGSDNQKYDATTNSIVTMQTNTSLNKTHLIIYDADTLNIKYTITSAYFVFIQNYNGNCYAIGRSDWDSTNKKYIFYFYKIDLSTGNISLLNTDSDYKWYYSGGPDISHQQEIIAYHLRTNYYNINPRACRVKVINMKRGTITNIITDTVNNNNNSSDMNPAVSVLNTSGDYCYIIYNNTISTSNSQYKYKMLRYNKTDDTYTEVLSFTQKMSGYFSALSAEHLLEDNTYLYSRYYTVNKSTGLTNSVKYKVYDADGNLYFNDTTQYYTRLYKTIDGDTLFLYEGRYHVEKKTAFCGIVDTYNSNLVDNAVEVTVNCSKIIEIPYLHYFIANNGGDMYYTYANIDLQSIRLVNGKPTISYKITCSGEMEITPYIEADSTDYDIGVIPSGEGRDCVVFENVKSVSM